MQIMRPWLMLVSACTFGGKMFDLLLLKIATLTPPASIICVDLIIRQLPGKKNFKIEESNPFLSSGLSLSFGVMVGLGNILWRILDRLIFVLDIFLSLQHAAVC